MLVPLDFLVPSLGLCRTLVEALDMLSSWMEEDEDEEDEFVDVDVDVFGAVGLVMVGIVEDGGEAMLLMLPCSWVCDRVTGS